MNFYRLLLFFVLLTSLSTQLAAFPRYILEWGELGKKPGQLNNPKGIATDSHGNVYVTDSKNHRVQKFDAHGHFITKWGKNGGDGTNGRKEGEFGFPVAIAVDVEDRVYVAERGGQRVQKFDQQGNFLLAWGKNAAIKVTFDMLTAMAISPKGNIYVLDAGLRTVYKFSAQGKLLKQWGDGILTSPEGIAVDELGSVYVSDTSTASIYKFTQEGELLFDLNANRKRFERPTALGIDPDGSIVVLDTAKRNLTKLGKDGKFFHSWHWDETHKGAKKLPPPEDFTIDFFGNTYFARTKNHRISKYAPPYNLKDFAVKPQDLINLTEEEIQALPPEFFNVLTQHDIPRIPPKLFKEFTSLDMSYFSPDALSKLSVEQFKAIPPEVLAGLTSDNVGALPPHIISEITVQNLDEIDLNTFQETRHLSKILTNLPPEFTPEKIKRYLPDDWQLDNKTGKLKPPAGAELMLRAFQHSDLPPKIRMFDNLPDFNTGLSLGGNSQDGKMLESLNRALTESGDSNLALFRFTQNKRGILVVQGSGKFAETTLAFISDVKRAIQKDESFNTGLTYDSSGRYLLTTPEKYQFALIPAPQDPEKLYDIFKRGEVNETEVDVGEAGDVILIRAAQARSDDFVHHVVVFDPFLNPSAPPPDDLSPGIYLNRNRSHTRASKPFEGTIVYNEGNTQTIRPTVYSPTTFIDLVLEVEGVEDIVHHTDGHFSIVYTGETLNLLPTFEVEVRSLEELERIEPNIEVNADKGVVTYTVQNESNVMTFTLLIVTI